jgi:cytoskeletal protein CcmA (bactofilin family)
VADKDDELDIPVKPERPPPEVRKPPLSAASISFGPAFDEAKPQPGTVTAPTLPAAFSVARAGAGPPDTKAASVATISTESRAAAVEAGVLVVGRQVSLVGEIKACRRLVVEGNVDANLQGCENIEIAETGLLQGQIVTDYAEVRGRFEGELVVKKLLSIRDKGQVSGTTTYGEIEIARAGKIVGGVEARDGANSGGWA